MLTGTCRIGGAMNTTLSVMAALSFGIASLGGCAAQGDRKVENRVFELRTYTAAPGKIEALHARFRDHTTGLFKKHDMMLIGFWRPTDAQQAQQQLVYLLAFPSQEAGAKSWKEFQADPAWIALKETS